MAGDRTYVGLAQLRVAAPGGVWTQVDIPVGARDALIQVDDPTSEFRVSVDNGLNPASEGSYVAASNGMTVPGTAAAVTTIYVAPANGTTCQVLYGFEA